MDAKLVTRTLLNGKAKEWRRGGGRAEGSRRQTRTCTSGAAPSGCRGPLPLLRYSAAKCFVRGTCHALCRPWGISFDRMKTVTAQVGETGIGASKQPFSWPRADHSRICRCRTTLAT